MRAPRAATTRQVFSLCAHAACDAAPLQSAQHNSIDERVKRCALVMRGLLSQRTQLPLQVFDVCAKHGADNEFEEGRTIWRKLQLRNLLAKPPLRRPRAKALRRRARPSKARARARRRRALARARLKRKRPRRRPQPSVSPPRNQSQRRLHLLQPKTWRLRARIRCLTFFSTQS